MTQPSATASATGIVLAGGRASRFGGPKLEARLGGETLLTLAIRSVVEVSNEVLVAGGQLPMDIGSAGVPIRLVPDDHPFGGPLIALAAGLGAVSTPLALVVGGDMPRLVPAVLRAMLERLAADASIDAVTLEGPAASAGDPPRRAVLPLALRVAPTAEAASAAVRAGDRSLVRLLDRLRSIEIARADWLPLDHRARTLLDIDRPADLAELERDLH